MEHINDIRAIQTLIAFVCFIGIVIWAYSSKRKKAFEEAARLPFDQDDAPASAERNDNP
jgi:cytochrome c oxidase cbb3-type subunit 4